MYIVSISDNSVFSKTAPFCSSATKVVLETTDRDEAHRVEKELRAQGYDAWVEFT